MIFAWLALGAIAIWALVRLGRQAKTDAKGEIQFSTAIFSAVCIGAAILAAMRGAWLLSSTLATAGLWFASGARRPVKRPLEDSSTAMSVEEARRVLGVGPAANREDIQSAWRRLMTRAHPDAGGSEGLAERLNQARDRLLKG